MSNVDYYEVLGVARSASPGSVRRAYRQKALATHPDKGGCAREFMLVVTAFEMLSSAQSTEDCSHHGGASKSVPRKRKKATEAKAATSPKEEAEGWGSKQTKRSPAEHLSECLRLLRCLIASADQADRRELLSLLSHPLQLRLLDYMKSFPEAGEGASGSQAAVLPPRADKDLDGEQNTSITPRRSASPGKEREDSASSGTGEDSDESAYSERELKDRAEADQVLALPWTEEDACAEDEGRFVCADMFAVQESQKPDDATSAADQCQERKYPGRKNKTGFRGLACWKDDAGTSVYRAKVTFAGIIAKCRLRRDLGQAVSDHVLLIHVRERFVQILQHRGVTIDDSEEQLDSLVSEFGNALSTVMLENDIHDGPEYFTFYSQLSLTRFIGYRAICTPTVRCVVSCLKHRNRLLQAKRTGWQAVRAVLIEFAGFSEPGHHRRFSLSSPEAVASRLDQEHAKSEAKRAYREVCGAAQREASARLQQEQALQKAQRRRVRCLMRLARKAESALRVVEAQKQREQHWQEHCRQRQLKEQERIRVQKLRQEQQQRWQWLKRRDLTMDEILRGPPMRCAEPEAER